MEVVCLIVKLRLRWKNFLQFNRETILIDSIIFKIQYHLVATD